MPQSWFGHTLKCALLNPTPLLLPLQDLSVPQVWFGHFYALGACINAALIAALALDGHDTKVRGHHVSSVKCERR